MRALQGVMVCLRVRVCMCVGVCDMCVRICVCVCVCAYVLSIYVFCSYMCVFVTYSCA